ncbi:MAG: peptidylprolyl isomerase [Candidatus Aenigmarchaeota archaeon]|nr:peptidylprolyl isomerase [Candidatus Aenigmarchaeota archaeon]
MQDKDFAVVSYSAKVKETGQQIDKAEKVPMVVREGYLLKGLEEPLKAMNVGDKKTIEVAPENAFGQRDFNLIKLISIAEFRKHGTKPTPGMFVEADRMRGKVLSVSGGRVKVDFNHPLAGKTIVYDLEINEKIDKVEEKIIALFNMYTKIDTAKMKITINEKQLDIDVPPMVSPIVKRRIANDATTLLEFDKVRYIETYDKPTQAQ